jgi:hypothetical protein
MHKGKLGLQNEGSKISTGIQIPGKDASDTGVRSAAPVAPSPATPASPAPAPVVSAPATVMPATPVPAKYISPKPAAAAPRPFTIPEPLTQSTPQASNQTVYESPMPRQTTYEPPASSTAPVSPAPASEKQSRPEPVLRQHKETPFLKIWEQVKTKLLNPKQGASPARQKVMILVAPILMVVFLLVVTQAVRKSPSTTATPSNKASAAVAFNGKINWELPAVIPDNLRDPMVFGATGQGKGTTSGPVVKGIVYSEDKSYAVVGDRIVSAGDTVGGATIVKINPDSVEFTMGDKNWTQKVER